MKKHLTLLSFAAALTLAAGAPQQALAAEVMTRLTSAHIADIFKAAGAKSVEITKPDQGRELVSVDSGDGTDDFLLSDCTSDGCQMLQMSMFFNKDERLNINVVNGFNSKYLDAQASLSPEGRVYLFDMYITNGGVTDENLRANLSVFLGAGTIFANFVKSQVVASNDTRANTREVSLMYAPGARAGVQQGPQPRNFELLAAIASRPGHRAHLLR